MKATRAISTMMATLILIAIVVFAGMLLWAMTSGFFKGGGKASIVISGTGSGSEDGHTATLNLVLQNSGDGAGRVTGIYVVEATSQAHVGGVTVVGMQLSSGVGAPQNIPSSVPNIGIDIPAKSTKQLMVQISGSGLYAGAQVRVYVVYYDLGSGQSSVASAVVTLH